MIYKDYNLFEKKNFMIKSTDPLYQTKNQKITKSKHYTNENFITHLHLSEFFDLLVEFSALPSILSHLLFLYQL